MVDRPHAVGLHPLDLGGVDGRPASLVDAACLRIGYSFKLALAAQVSNSANTPSIFFDDQTRQLAAAHADLSLVRLNRRGRSSRPWAGKSSVGPHLTLATTEPILVQTREEPLLEALVLPSFPCPVRF